jgi:cell division protein FtsB
MIFLDKYNLFTQVGLQSDIRKLNKDQAFYKTKLEKVVADKEALSKNIEKFARERYLMHKSNEEVYIIVDKSKKSN